MPKVIEVPAQWFKDLLSMCVDLKYASNATTEAGLKLANEFDRVKVAKLVGFVESGKALMEMKEKDV